MQELTLVVLLIGAVASMRWLTAVNFSFSLMTEAGWALLVLGLIEGVPTGFYYHVLLYRILKPRGKLPRGWWWSPSKYHIHLTPGELLRIRFWFVLGGIGFLLCVAGGGMALVGMFQGFV